MATKKKVLHAILGGTISILIFSFCDREDLVPDPALGIYLSSPDYFSYFAPSTNESGEVVVTPYFQENDSRIYITETDTMFSRRVTLSEGYVLSGEIYPEAPFTDVSYKECFRRQDTESPITADLLNNRIIDTDPFTEYYYVDVEFVTKYRDQFRNLGYSSGKEVYLSFQEAAKEINKIISEGNLEEHFTKVK